MTTKNKDFALDPDVIDVIKKIISEEKSNYILHSGLGNKQQKIIVADYLQTENEIALKGKTNSLIVLGADRPAGVNSGQGGVGHTACAAIDLIAGFAGRTPVNVIDGVVQKTSKNFELDAARVYISQFCDLDEYFGIPTSYIGGGSVRINVQESKARSGVGIKADVVRIIGKENIKIATSHVSTNSVNLSVNKGGVDIIAGYEDPSPDSALQPMVKGDNLLAFLQLLSKAIIDVQSNLSNFIDSQIKINNFLANHRHQYYFGATNIPIDGAKISSQVFRIEAQKRAHISVNIERELEEKEFFQITSTNYINSKFNRVN